jgi:DNA-binding transcriptional LysR family regulator
VTALQPSLGAGTEIVALRMLCLVSERGSLSAAGAALGVTQQAVSARMRRLEAALGLTLLDRSSTGTRLTATGEVVAGWAADVVAAADRLESGAATLRAARPEDASVAASLTIAEHLLPRWIVRLRSLAPDARVAVTAANSSDVFRLIRAGDALLGFVETPEAASGLRTTRIARDELIVVAAPDHPWAKRGRSGVTAAELSATALVTREAGSGTRLAAERALGSAGLSPAPPAVELPTAAGIRTAVTSGLAPAVLSILTVQDDLDSGRLVRIPLTDLRIVRDLRAVWRRDADLPDTLRRLVAVARSFDR